MNIIKYIKNAKKFSGDDSNKNFVFIYYWCIIACMFSIVGIVYVMKDYLEGSMEYWLLVGTVYYIFFGGVIFFVLDLKKEYNTMKICNILMDNMEKM